MKYYSILKAKAGKALLASALAGMLTLCGCADAYKPVKDSYGIRVMLRDCEGITIEGDNIIDTEYGRSVTFRMSIDDDYIYIGNSAGAEYNPETGRLRLTNIIAPATVDVSVVKQSEAILFRVKNKNHSASVSVEEKLLARPEKVKVKAEYPEYLEFAGWSEGGYLEDGGNLISTDDEYTFKVDKTKTVYANFSGFTDYGIVYHLNGGHVKDKNDETYTVNGEYNELYAMQQTLESNGTFVRDGYVAVGYSASPAEYGDYDSANGIPGFSNMGGVTRVDGKSLDLYVVWAKISDVDDFEYEKKNISYISDSSYSFGSLNQKKTSAQGIEITGYTGDDRLVVIPEEIDGLPVMSIAKDAFSGNMHTVVIPRTVKNIMSGAFEQCEDLSEVVFFDSVVTVYNKSFNENVKTVVLNAQRLPVYSGAIEGSFCIKYERLRQLADEKKIVIVSGSSSLNGINSEQFEELMPGYSVVNYGTNVANPALFYLEAISKYVTEGDIVVHAPEFNSSSSMGSNVFHAKMFRGNEQCYDIFRDVDMTNYVGFWEAFCEFQVGDKGDGSLVPAVHQQGKIYQLPTEINKYGDRSTVRKRVAGNFGGASENFKYNILNYTMLNQVNELYTEKGATLAMSFGTFDKSRMSPSSAKQSEYDKFTNDCAEKLDYPVISNVETYIMEHKHFYDSEWHLNDEGARIRTENLANDIKAYLSDPTDY